MILEDGELEDDDGQKQGAATFFDAALSCDGAISTTLSLTTICNE